MRVSRRSLRSTSSCRVAYCRGCLWGLYGLLSFCVQSSCGKDAHWPFQLAFRIAAGPATRASGMRGRTRQATQKRNEKKAARIYQPLAKPKQAPSGRSSGSGPQWQDPYGWESWGSSDRPLAKPKQAPPAAAPAALGRNDRIPTVGNLGAVRIARGVERWRTCYT